MEMRKLLVVHDPNREEQPALEIAARIAGDIGARILLFGCIHSEVSGAEYENEEVKRLLREHKARLDALLEPVAAMGVEVSSEVDWDKDWHHAIVRAAARDFADIVFKTSLRNPRRRVLKFTGDSILIRECLCPVLLIKRAEQRETSTILAAIDIKAKNPNYQKLNQHVIEFSRRVVATLQADVHIVNAFPDFRLVPDRAEIVEQTGVPSDHVHIKLGAPDKVIVDVAKNIDASLVVVGNSHRSGLAALLHGNTAEKILGKLQCNVLAMP
ncbi:universal stress protein [Haliea sp. E17]|uniref:universal stress protein n=1 Tax=Haliea sp. E17 TaxID=3401576 RepID=UPI003AAD1276